MSQDTMKVFDSFLREWCEQRGWPYQPVSDGEDARMSIEGALIDAEQYWAEIEGTDEWELANLHDYKENQ